MAIFNSHVKLPEGKHKNNIKQISKNKKNVEKAKVSRKEGHLQMMGFRHLYKIAGG